MKYDLMHPSGDILQTNVQALADYAAVLIRLARILERKGNKDEALEYASKSLEIINFIEKITGEIHPYKSGLLDNIGLILERQKRYKEAEDKHREALEIRTELLVPEHPELAFSLNNLASVLEEQGQYDQAEQLFLEALALKEKRLPEGLPSLAITLRNLARFYAERQKYDEASSYYIRAANGVSREERLDIASYLFNLATFYYEPQEQYSKAESLYEQALKIRRQELGKNHDDVAVCFNNLASIYQHLERYEDAEDYFIKAFEIWQQLGDSFKPSAAIALNNLAGLYGKWAGLSGEVELYAEAETQYSDALQILLDCQDPYHHQTLQVWGHFLAFLRDVIKRGQTAQLSDHPATQKLIRKLQEESEEDCD